ncbi:MAG: uracil-DNA glycosylase [bacterium]|nr:uracil-DNA glycosylase [Gammaproteobacteria bacterium]HIL95258.1 uracil-DNA glycosylase [Pseudomonadales bacterium]
MTDVPSASLRVVQLHDSWFNHLGDEFDLPYMKSLRQFLVDEKDKGRTTYPRGNEYFNALNSTPLDKTRVIIIGQDPYHGPGQAHGLCFSVQKQIRIPPSLVNIFKEIQSDLGTTEAAQHGNLTAWADQGVLLLNSVLTVEKHKAASHQGKGWEKFTDKVIEVVATQRENCVFLLWGSYAQKKGQMIDHDRHLVLTAPHPSPLSAHRGFFGCRHFSRCNDFLNNTGQTPIDWTNS